MNVRAERFPLFDGLRAIAAIAVLTFHAGYFASIGNLHPPLERFWGRLDVGVELFFLISAFLLYRPFVRARLNGQPMPHVGAYAWRRFLRIVPAYWLALTVISVWLGLSYVFTPAHVLTFYGFGQIYSVWGGLRGIGQAWTLCVEVTFYAFLPLWALFLRAVPAGDRRRRLTIEIAALVALVILSELYKAWALTRVAPAGLNQGPYLSPLPNFLDDFALGMALAVASVWYEGRALPAPLALARRFPLACWALALAAFWAVSTQIGFNGYLVQAVSRRTFVEQHALYAAVAFFLLLPAAFGEPGRGVVGRLLPSRLLSYLGLVSYGIYLWHFAVVKQLEQWLNPLLPGSWYARFAVYLPLTLLGATAIASVSYYVLERPTLSLKRLFWADTRAPRAEAPAEPAPATPHSA